MERLESLFQARNLRLTAPRQALFTLLASAGTPLDIATITERIDSGDRTSIYRNLDIFIELGVVQIIPVGWKKRYELAAPFAPHHHHLQCTTCGELIQLDTPQLENAIHAIADKYNYKLTAHHIELSGTCKNCQPSETR